MIWMERDCINQTLLRNKLPQNLVTSNNSHLLAHNSVASVLLCVAFLAS